MTRTFIPNRDGQLWTALRDNVTNFSWEIRDRLALSTADRSALEDREPDSSLSPERIHFLRAFIAMIARSVNRYESAVVAAGWGTAPESALLNEVITFDSMWFGISETSSLTTVQSELDTVSAGYAFPVLGTWHDGIPSMPDDLTVTPLTGWGEGFTLVRPNEERLAGLPAQIREIASRSVPSNSLRGVAGIVVYEDGSMSIHRPTGPLSFTADDLISEARALWRARVSARMRTSETSQEFERKRAEHRRKTQQNWNAFIQSREKTTEQLVGTLPFVPHGLASSRRWGIEVESGGARGVECPPDWNVHSDGSLRSAYEGYVEVQDFEPYDREEEYTIFWGECDFDHNPRQEIYDAENQQYIWIPNEAYTDPRQCDSCGRTTRTVRVEPQTVHHRSAPGDCREFVSPILTSMHSNGLQALCEALSKNPQNSSAGVHVHVEADDLDSKQIATLVYGYGLLEPILEASYRRERRDFCEARDPHAILDAARSASRGYEFDPDDGSRYVTVNTHSLSNHGTIEFRAMGPVYEYEYLVRWAMLCRELVNTVAAGATNRDFAKVKSWQDLLNMLAMFGKEYVRASVYEMTGEVGEVAKLEKAGEPVTNEALDADLASAAGSFATTLRRMTGSLEDLTRRLVGVGGTSET